MRVYYLLFWYLGPGISGNTPIEGAISQSIVTKLKRIPVFPSPKSNAIADAEAGKDAVPLSLYCYSMIQVVKQISRVLF